MRLLDNLGRLRREVGPITPELSDALADHMGIRRGEVHEVVRFYSFLVEPVDAWRVCTGPVCDCMGARDLLAAAPPGRRVLEVPCLGHCELAPVVLDGDRVVPDAVHRCNDGPSLGLGTRDETLADHERRGGLALLREQPSRDRIVEELNASGLAGLGGAGFPTGVKWEAVVREARPRYVVVNAGEGGAGAIKDPYGMGRRPPPLLEGAVVAVRFARGAGGVGY